MELIKYSNVVNLSKEISNILKDSREKFASLSVFNKNLRRILVSTGKIESIRALVKNAENYTVIVTLNDFTRWTMRANIIDFTVLIEDL